MRALVTGGAGFLGSHLCERLIQGGDDVICMDNLLTGSRTNIQKLLSHPHFQFLEADVTQPIEIDGPLERIFHFASPASPLDYLRYPIETLKVGALGTQNTLDLAKTKGAQYLLASTSEVYGDPLAHPQPEAYWGNVNSVGPRGVYDEAKRFAEAITMAYHHVHGIKTHIARIFNTVGPRMRPGDGRAIPTFIRQALKEEPLTIFGDGRQTRSFCYAEDMIDGILKLMEADFPKPVNLGNPEEYSIKEIAQWVLKATGSHSSMVYRDLPQDDPKRRCPDIALAKKLLNWEPKVPFKEGLRRTLQWFKEEGLSH